MDALSPFISILCHSDRLFHRESCPRLDVVYPGRAWSSSPAYTWHCSLHYFFLQAINSLVSSWCDHSMLASSLCLKCLTVSTVSNSSLFSVYSSFVENRLICFLCYPRNTQNLSQSFHIKGLKTCFFIFPECPAFTAVRDYRPH